MTSLFQLGDFRSHAGQALAWKIECDSLSEADMACLSRQALKLILIAGVYAPRFIGIPHGGLRLAKTLTSLVGIAGSMPVVVDDVYTTGQSMREALRRENAQAGLVLFARGHIVEPNVYALFQLHRWLCAPGDTP